MRASRLDNGHRLIKLACVAWRLETHTNHTGGLEARKLVQIIPVLNYHGLVTRKLKQILLVLNYHRQFPHMAADFLLGFGLDSSSSSLAWISC